MVDAPDDLGMLPLPEEGAGSLTSWVSAIQRDETLRKKKEPLWKENIRRYKNASGASLTKFGISGRETINVNIDYANTEAKKALLFFQSPELQLQAKRVDDVQAAPLAQAVINYKLNYDINVMATVDQILTDLICPAGLGVTVIGYECFKGPDIEEPVMEDVTDEFTGQPVLGLDGQPAQRPAVDPETGEPLVNSLPNIIRESYFWERETPMKVGIPASFTGSDYDQAPYLWREVLTDKDTFKARYGVDYEAATVSQDDNRLTTDPDQQATPNMVRAIEVWYRSSVYRVEATDPERYTQLILAMGRGGSRADRSQARIIVHRDSPYQVLDGRGRVISGMRGNPIHILTLRYVSDDPYPPSDCSMSRAQVDELSLSRSQMVQQRRRNLPLRWVNTSVDPSAKATIERLEKGEIQGIIPLLGDGNQIIGSVQQSGFPRENFTFQDIIERDIAREWALGANQNGTATDAQTATEATIMQNNTDSRLSAERAKVLRWYVRGAEKVFSLIQQFADDADFVPMLGPDGAEVLTQWNKTAIQGLFRFEARPDSTIRMDASQERELFLRLYNLAANDPNFNRIELDRMLAQKFHLDPGRVVVAQPPQPPPDRPKMSVSITGMDLSPMAPQFPVVEELLKANGTPISDGAVQMGQTIGQMFPQLPHGGAANKVPTIDQHAADRTGERTGPKVGPQ